MFHASTGQTLTRTNRRHDSRSAAIDGSKFNPFKSFSTHSFQVFLPSPLPTLPDTSYSVQRLTRPDYPFVVHAHTSVICSLSQSTICCLYQVGCIILARNGVPVPKSHTTHYPYNRVFSPLQPVEVPLFHQPGLTAVNHGTSDATITNLPFQIMICSM